MSSNTASSGLFPTIGKLLKYFSGSSSNTSNRDELRRRSRSFRLSLIPVAVTFDELHTYLQSLDYDLRNKPPRSDARGNLLALSLVRKSTWQVATATFIEEPSQFANCTPNHSRMLSLEIAGMVPAPIIVDIDFYGITPLYSSPSHQPTVE